MKQPSIYDLIKKQNGETFARTIRDYDSGIFDVPNIVRIVKYAGRDATPLLEYLESLKKIEIKNAVYEDPFILLDKAGYNAYYADTLEKQNAISKYFTDNEKLCTFRDNHRYKDFFIINAVKKNVDTIVRKRKPKREDAYGTSVISIQISKKGGFISIKNRYNHTLRDENPDNTFNSNPDNIINGLAYSLKQYFQVDFSNSTCFLPESYIFCGDRIIKFYSEGGGIYFGDGFYVYREEIYEIDKRKQLLIEDYLFDIQKKKMIDLQVAFAYLQLGSEKPPPKHKYTPHNIVEMSCFEDDGFIMAFNNEIASASIQIQKSQDGKKSILANGKEILRLNNSFIEGIFFNKIKNIHGSFLSHLRLDKLEKVFMENVESVGSYFLSTITKANEISMPNLKKAKDGFLFRLEQIDKLNIPKLQDIPDQFLPSLKNVNKLNLSIFDFIRHYISTKDFNR